MGAVEVEKSCDRVVSRKVGLVNVGVWAQAPQCQVWTLREITRAVTNINLYVDITSATCQIFERNQIDRTGVDESRCWVTRYPRDPRYCIFVVNIEPGAIYCLAYWSPYSLSDGACSAWLSIGAECDGT